MPNTILICRHNKNGTGYCEHLGEYCVEGPCKAEELIEYAPLRHGRWRFGRMGSGICSECGRVQMGVWDYDNWQNYCGHCGAKMDKEE